MLESVAVSVIPVHTLASPIVVVVIHVLNTHTHVLTRMQTKQSNASALGDLDVIPALDPVLHAPY